MSGLQRVPRTETISVSLPETISLRRENVRAVTGTLKSRKARRERLTPSLVNLPKNAEYELFHYPAKALDQSANEQASKLRMQAVEADHETIEGSIHCQALAAGRKFKPYEVAHADHVFEEYVVTGVVHRIVDHSYETAEDGSLDYSNSFIALPSRFLQRPIGQRRNQGLMARRLPLLPDRPARKFTRMNTAASRFGSRGNGTAPRRMAPIPAGYASCNHGLAARSARKFIPRIGMEVMVTYLEGDPDRPVVTGIVPNPSTKVPYTLAREQDTYRFQVATQHEGRGFNASLL